MTSTSSQPQAAAAKVYNLEHGWSVKQKDDDNHEWLACSVPTKFVMLLTAASRAFIDFYFQCPSRLDGPQKVISKHWTKTNSLVLICVGYQTHMLE